MRKKCRDYNNCHKEGIQMIDTKKSAGLPDGVKQIFDLISPELHDALQFVQKIEKGTTNAKAKEYARRAAYSIREAGRICAACGMLAKQDWDGGG
jgi:hypothetical protein